MYGQGNFGPPAAKGPYTSSSSSVFQQQYPAASMPPFSQGSQPPLTTFMQHCSPHFLSPVDQLGHPSYEHAPVLHQLGPPLTVPSSGGYSQPYLTTPPFPSQPLQGHANSHIPQNSQWLQNANFVPQAVPAVAPTVLPPPPPQGHTVYGNSLRQPPSSSVQAHQQAHDQASSFFTSQVGAFRQPQNSNIPVARPPPPSSPPVACPHPLPSPAPTSSVPFSNDTPIPNPTVSHPTSHAQNSSRTDTPVGPTDGVSHSHLVVNDACKPDGFRKGNCDGYSASKISSSCTKNCISDIPPPPPKPVDDRTVRSIEILCQFIAKNGPEFEDMTRKKEFGNPQFKFLFGGEPGSEDAVASEYFMWMKSKCQLEFKSTGAQKITDSPVRPLAGYSSQLNTDTAVPSSSADSDMDMEDDITHPNDELPIHPSNNPSNTVPVSSLLDVKGHMLCIQDHSLGEGTMVGNSLGSESVALVEQRQGSNTSSDQNQSIIRMSAAKADRSVMGSSGNGQIPLDGKVQISFSSVKTDFVECSSEEPPDQLVKGTSPFRLLQDYASEGCSEDEAHNEDAVPSTAILATEVHSRRDDKNMKINFSDLGPESLLASNVECNPLSESHGPQDFSSKSQDINLEADVTAVKGKSKFVNIYNDQGLVEDGVSHVSLNKESASTDASVMASTCKKDAMNVSTEIKVDKFGRLIREGASDSDSDGSPRYNGRRGKRDRSRSRSRSPYDRRRRWRRRSPRGRKERHGRSRSCSPRRRTSRSKSPLYRDEYPGDKMRRDKGVLPECFDFRRGKCYRGASCRYLHHEENHERSRSNRSKQSLQELARSSRRSDLNEKIENSPQQKKSRGHDGGVQVPKPCEDMPNVNKKILSEPASSPSDVVGHSEPGILQNHAADPGRHHVIPTSVGKLEQEQSQGHYTDQGFLNFDQQQVRIDKSSDSSPMEMSEAIPNQIPGDKPQLNKGSIIDVHTTFTNVNKPENIPFQSIASHQSNVPAAKNIFHFPPSSCPLPLHEMAASYAQQVSSATNSASFENYAAYKASMSNLPSQFPIPSNPTWKSLPPPPAPTHLSHPPVNDVVQASSTHGQYNDRPIHFQPNMRPPQNQFLARNFTDPFITEIPAGSHIGQNQTYPLLQGPVRPSHPLDKDQQTSKLHGGVDLNGKDFFTGRPLLGSYPLNSYVADSLHSQALPFSRDSRESPSKRIPPAGSVSSLPGDDGKSISTMSRYTSGLFDRDQPSIFAELGVSRTSSHYNPYASTFEQPLSSKFSSNIITPEKDRAYGSHFGAAYSFRHAPGGGRALSLGSNTISPQNTVQEAQGALPGPIGDQYDPLYDFIEPSSNSVKKSGHNFEATGESDIMVRMMGSNKPCDGEENKQKGEGIALTASIENEEYGETADAEVGTVEDGSPSSPNNVEDTAAGEVEIDQVKAPGKNKKNKESRSMKLFKVAIANFVKEVLKPSWRQGNMSKEAFKTIVKKTVDKVSGAMKSHQIPKSQSKINHYIDSSERKLTKLVMGYMDKYVKV